MNILTVFFVDICQYYIVIEKKHTDNFVMWKLMYTFALAIQK